MARAKVTDKPRKLGHGKRKKYTAQGSGRSARFTNKHARKNYKKYRGQGR